MPKLDRWLADLAQRPDSESAMHGELLNCSGTGWFDRYGGARASDREQRPEARRGSAVLQEAGCTR